MQREKTTIVSRNGLLCNNVLIYEAIQIVLPKCYRITVPHQVHFLALAGHPGTKRVYDFFKKSSFWPQKTGDVPKVVLVCEY